MTRNRLVILVSMAALLLIGLSGPARADSAEGWQAGKGQVLLASNHRAASQQHQVACRRWCAAHRPPCVRCSPLPGCGPGYRRLQAFRGRGKNWYACGRTRAGQASQHRQGECQRWCRANPQCVRCTNRLRCGRGLRRLRTFRGRGRNWRACGRR